MSSNLQVSTRPFDWVYNLETKKGRVMDPVIGVVQPLVTTLPHASTGRVRWFPRTWEKIMGAEFVIGWQIQGRLSNPTLVVLLAAVPWHVGVVLLPLVALTWGMAACSYYEFRRRHGVACLYRDPSDEAKVQEVASRHNLLGWCGYLLKVVFILGIVNVLTTKILCHLHRRYRSQGEANDLAARVILVIGIGKSGVMAARHFLEQAGYPKKRVYQLNLVGRVLEVPFKMADVLALYVIYLVLPLPNIAGLPMHGALWLVGAVYFITRGWI